MNKSILDSTLEELDGENWGEPTFDSYVVINCHRLRRVPLGQFTTEDLRLVIGQGRWLEYLVPLALEKLQQNPLIAGSHFDGDLLMAMLKERENIQKIDPAWYADLSDIVSGLLETSWESKEMPAEIEQEVDAFLDRREDYLNALDH